MNSSGANRLRALKRTRSRNLIKVVEHFNTHKKTRLKKHSPNAGVFCLMGNKLSEKNSFIFLLKFALILELYATIPVSVG